MDHNHDDRISAQLVAAEGASGLRQTGGVGELDPYALNVCECVSYPEDREVQSFSWSFFPGDFHPWEKNHFSNQSV